MKTTFLMAVTLCACTSCSTISPAVRSPFKPMVPAHKSGMKDRHVIVLTPASDSSNI